MSSNGRPEYVTIKNWKKWQHYKDREPPWVKIHSRLLADDGFMGLTEADQWQLVRIWLVAARSSKYTLDGDQRRTPVLSCKERSIRRAINSIKRVPLDQFIADGWLIPVKSKDVHSYAQPAEMLDERLHGDSTTQAPVASTLLELEKTEEERREANNGPALPALDFQALPNYEGHEYKLWKRLCVAAGVAAKPKEITKLENVVKAHRSTERELVMAIEAATGPGVNDPLAVALAELKNLALERKRGAA